MGELAQMGLIAAVTPEKAVRSPASYDMAVRLSVASVDAVRQAPGHLALGVSLSVERRLRARNAATVDLEWENWQRKPIAASCCCLSASVG